MGQLSASLCLTGLHEAPDQLIRLFYLFSTPKPDSSGTSANSAAWLLQESVLVRASVKRRSAKGSSATADDTLSAEAVPAVPAPLATEASSTSTPLWAPECSRADSWMEHRERAEQSGPHTAAVLCPFWAAQVKRASCRLWAAWHWRIYSRLASSVCANESEQTGTQQDWSSVLSGKR